MTKDLTTGKPMRLILSFGLPILLGTLFQQLYNLVDTAIVGKILGGAALAAVGSTGSINFLVVGFSTGICSGFAIPVAQQFGASNHYELRRYVTGSAWLCALFGVVLTGLTVLLCGDILRLIHTPDDIFARAYAYIVTIFAGLPAYLLYNYAAGILRSLGDSRTPVIWLIAASLLNIALDVAFILWFHMDVFGAALATVLSQLMAGVGCLVRMVRGFPVLRTQREDWAWSWRRAGHLCMMGLPMGLQFSITAIGSVMLQSSVNTLGTMYVTASTAANKVSNFVVCPLDSMGATMATYAGQNVGAEKYDRIRQGVGSCLLLAAGYSLVTLVLIRFAGGWLCSLFLDSGSMELLPLADQFLNTVAAFYFPLGVIFILRLTIQGMGFSPLATLSGVLEMVARCVVSCLVPVYGYLAVCYASPVAWVSADLFLVPAFLLCWRRLARSSGSRTNGRAAALGY